MIDPGESGDLRGEREGLGGAARGISELVRVPIAETPERRRDPARIAWVRDRPALTVHDPLGGGGPPGRGAGEVRMRRAVLRVEALRVPPVVDDRETLARDAVEVGDLRRAATGDRDDVRSRREHAPLELEHDAVEQRATPARIAHALEVGPVATLPRPVDVLAERALVALHDVPTAAGHDDARDSRERQGARHGGGGGEREPPPCDARHPRLAIRAQEVDVVAVLYQRVHETGRRPLDAAVKDEGARDDEKLHAESRRSMRGNRVARAARKLYRSSQRRRAPPPSSPASPGGSRRRPAPPA